MNDFVFHLDKSGTSLGITYQSMQGRTNDVYFGGWKCFLCVATLILAFCWVSYFCSMEHSLNILSRKAWTTSRFSGAYILYPSEYGSMEQFSRTFSGATYCHILFVILLAGKGCVWMTQWIGYWPFWAKIS